MPTELKVRRLGIQDWVPVDTLRPIIAQATDELGASWREEYYFQSVTKYLCVSENLRSVWKALSSLPEKRSSTMLGVMETPESRCQSAFQEIVYLGQKALSQHHYGRNVREGYGTKKEAENIAKKCRELYDLLKNCHRQTESLLSSCMPSDLLTIPAEFSADGNEFSIGHRLHFKEDFLPALDFIAKTFEDNAEIFTENLRWSRENAPLLWFYDELRKALPHLGKSGSMAIVNAIFHEAGLSIDRGSINKRR